jgi:uncharacterized membrane protein
MRPSIKPRPRIRQALCHHRVSKAAKRSPRSPILVRDFRERKQQRTSWAQTSGEGMSYLLLKYIHILSATLLFGTGLGTAFHGFLAFRSRDARVVAAVGSSVVLADWLFTAPAVIVQPATGIAMALQNGLPLTTGWIALAFVLYALVGACWLPVVWLQIELRKMGRASALSGEPLPRRYFRFLLYWFLLGWPAFIGVLVIFYLMVFKPDIGW